MAKKCAVCGKSTGRLIASPSHPGKSVCLSCLNEMIFNKNNIEKELAPLRSALGKALAAFKDEWEKQDK